MVMRGEAPEDEQLLGSLVQAISYTNAKNYFGFLPQLINSNSNESKTG